MKTENIKEFNWSSETGAKAEYHEWYSLMTRHCSTAGIVFTISSATTERMRPLPPKGPPTDSTSGTDFREYAKLYDAYKVRLRTHSGLK